MIIFFNKFHERPLPYNMITSYNINNNAFLYIITLLYTYWAGISVILHLVAEDNLFGIILANLYGRIYMIHNEIKTIYKDSLSISKQTKQNIFNIFHEKLNSSIRKLVILYK